MVSKCCICKKKAWCFDNDGKTPYCKDCWDKTHKDLSLQCNCSDNECCSNCPEKLNNKMIKTLKDIEFERAYDYYNPMGGSRKICLSKDLRKEAIKHILEISSDNWDTIYYSNPLFIRFFNITEKEIDDAKNKNEVKG